MSFLDGNLLAIETKELDDTQDVLWIHEKIPLVKKQCQFKEGGEQKINRVHLNNCYKFQFSMK